METIVIALTVAAIAIFKKECLHCGQMIFMMARCIYRSPVALFNPSAANWITFEIWEEKVSQRLTRSFRDVETDITGAYHEARGRNALKARGRFKHHMDRFLRNPLRYYKDVIIALKNAKELAMHHQAQVISDANASLVPGKPESVEILNKLSTRAEAEGVGRLAELVEVAMPVLRMLRQVEFMVLSGVHFYQARKESLASTLDRGVKVSV